MKKCEKKKWVYPSEMYLEKYFLTVEVNKHTNNIC